MNLDHHFGKHLLAAAMVAGTLAAPTTAAAQSTPDPIEATWERLSTRLLAMCPNPATTNLDELLKAEGNRTFEVRGRTSRAEGWFDLACVRARLYALDAIAREGLVMLPGDSWGQGAISALLEGLKRQPDSTAAELLGVLSFDVHPDRLRRGMREFFRRNAQTANLGRFALRACSALYRDEGETSAADDCSNRALHSGVDSTWQLLSLARSDFLHGDTAQGMSRFVAAAASIHDDDDMVALDWHLDWFLEPEELAVWDTVSDSRADWVRNLLAERDLRDGQPDGSRLAEHFTRLEAVDTMFRMERPLLRQRRFELTASPENVLAYEWVAKWTEKDPAGVPARPFRFYQRTHPEYDDRAAVWMRWGPPDLRNHALPYAYIEPRLDTCRNPQAEPPRNAPRAVCLPAGTHTNSREGWLYRFGDNSILLSFEGEDFDATGSATRLVTGVLGFYFCGMETTRCNLTTRSSTPGIPALTPEELQRVSAADQALIDHATTHDGNAAVRMPLVRVVADAGRVWTGQGGEVVMLLWYAARAEDLDAADRGDTTATLELNARQWNAATARFDEAWRDRQVSLPRRISGSDMVSGVLELPSDGAVRSWSLQVSGDAGESGSAWGRGLPPLALANGFALSDIIVGQRSGGRMWSGAGRAVPVGPAGGMSRTEPVSVFVQVRSAEDAEVRVQLTLEPLQRRGGQAVRIGYLLPVGAGLNTVLREIDVGHLDSGRYQLRIAVARAGGEVIGEREVEVVFR